MELVIDSKIKALIPALKAEEYTRLKESITREGCRDPLVIWSGQNTILDGHNRYQICQELGASYNTVSLEFPNKDSAMLWILKNQLGKRNLSSYQFRLLVGQEYELEKKLHGGDKRSEEFRESSDQIDHMKTRENIAQEHKLAPASVQRSAELFKAHEEIKNVAPGVAEKLGTMEIRAPARDIRLLGKVLAGGTPEQKEQVVSEINEDLKKGIETAKKILSSKPDPLPELSNARDDYLRSKVSAAIPPLQNNAANHALIAARIKETFCPRCGKAGSEVLRWSCCDLSVEEAAKEVRASKDGLSSKVDEKTKLKVSEGG